MSALAPAFRGRPPRALFLDLDNTLYAYAPCHRAALLACARVARKRAGLSLARFTALYLRCRAEIHHRLARWAASHHRMLYFQEMAEAIRGRTDGPLALELYDTYWNVYLSRMRLAPGAAELLSHLNAREIPCVVVSDLTAREQLRKLTVLRIQSKVNFLVTSEEAGEEKPGAAIFRLAFRKARCKPGDAWMVGDSLERDVAGAQRLGIVSILFRRHLSPKERRRTDGPRPDGCVDSFSGLLEMLR